jgi:hypothetical protein
MFMHIYAHIMFTELITDKQNKKQTSKVKA